MGLAGRCSAAIAFYVVFALPAAAHAAVTGAAFRVQNINTISHPDPGPDPYRYPATVVGDRIFFGATSFRTGRELWVSDGTRAGTRLVTDLEPGPNGSLGVDITNPWMAERLYPLANGVVFTATVGGRLHVAFSDGTAVGTVLLIPDIRIESIAVLDNRAFIASGTQLWVTDGTDAGTRLVRDFADPVCGDPWLYPTDLTAVPGGVVFTSRLDRPLSVSSLGVEPWFSDGSPDGTYVIRDVRSGGASSIGRGVQAIHSQSVFGFRSVAYFFADDGSAGRDLWRTDGTVDGTRRVVDLGLGTDDCCPRFAELVEFSGALYFVGSDEQGYLELWRTEGSAGDTVQVTDVDLKPGAAFGPYISDGVLSFGYYDYSSLSSYTWISDGTSAGTRLRLPSDDTEPSVWATVNGRVLLKEPAGEGQFQTAIFRENFPLVALRAADSSEILTTAFYPTPVPFRNGVLFSRYPIDGELWWTDGTPGGTFPLRDPGGPDQPTRWDESSSPRELTVSGDALYFSAEDGVHGRELWRMNEGERAAMVADLVEGESGSNPTSLVALNDGLFFFGQDETGTSYPYYAPVSGPALRLANVHRVPLRDQDFIVFDEPVPPVALSIPSAGVIVFLAVDDHGELELWRTDGTAQGTFPLGLLDSRGATFLGVAGGEAYLCARGGTDRLVFWSTDGSSSGTTVSGLPCGYSRLWKLGDKILVGDGNIYQITPSLDGAVRETFAGWESQYSEALGGLLFGVWDGRFRRSDGTMAGTRAIEAFEGRVRVIGDRLLGIRTIEHPNYVTTSSPMTREFWGTDGRPGGLRQLAKFSFPGGPFDPWGPGWEQPWPAVLRDTIYFSADDGSSGNELWGISLDHLPEVCLADDCVPSDVPVIRASPTATRTAWPQATPCDTPLPTSTVVILPTPTPKPTHTTTPIGSATPRCDEENAHSPEACAAIHWNSMEARRGQVLEVSATLTTTRNSVAGLQVDISVPASVHLLSDSNSAPACRVTEGFDGLVANFAWPAASRDRVRALFVSPESPQAIPDGEHSFACKAQVSADAPLGGGPGRLQQVVATDPFGRVIYPTIHNGTLTVAAGEPPTADLPGWACECDCDESRAVSVDELLAGTNITLGLLPESVCLPTRRDLNWDVGRIVTCVGRALSGCPVP